MQDRNHQDNKFHPVDHHEIKSYLDRGYRIEDLQRITDREAVVTLRLDPAPSG
jgi:predicted GNAT superfamily acetyltransferase